MSGHQLHGADDLQHRNEREDDQDDGAEAAGPLLAVRPAPPAGGRQAKGADAREADAQQGQRDVQPRDHADVGIDEQALGLRSSRRGGNATLGTPFRSSAAPAVQSSRIAIVSDIHGNLPALEAVWSAIAREQPARVVNLGDIASGPLWPAETVRWLMARAAAEPARWCTIAGNHERQALAAHLARMGASDAYAARALGAPERAWLAALPGTRWLCDDVLLCHGTPASDLVYFMETVIPGFGVDGQRGVRAASASELHARAAETPQGDARAGLSAALILCGHTHVPRAMAVPGGPLVVNPGSVGLQAYDDVHPHPHFIEVGAREARWAMVERDRQGGWHVQLRSTPYDWRAAVARARANGRDDWADALATGFVGRTEPTPS
jgi:predicted phosphodiesterase